MRIKIFLLLMVLAACSCNTQKQIDKPKPDKNTYLDGKMVFIKAIDLTEAIETAEKKNKPLFIMFEADWCLPCKVMSDEVFTHKETADFLNKHFVNYKLDVEEGSGPNMKMLYGVNILPTLLFVDHKGRTLSRNDGSLMHNGLINLADEALSNWEAVTNAQ